MTDPSDSKSARFGEVILPEEYVGFYPLTAEIQINRSERGVAIEPTLLHAWTKSLQRLHPEDWANRLYDAGFDWGVAAYGRIESLALSVFPEVRQIKDLNMSRFHQLFTNHLAATGWGNFELKRRDGFLFVDLYDSFVVHGLKTAESSEADRASTVCHLYAGFFGGVFSRISNMSLACVEITCQHDGFENCSFLLDNADTVAMIQRRIQGGASPLEAYQKVRKDVEEQFID